MPWRLLQTSPTRHWLHWFLQHFCSVEFWQSVVLWLEECALMSWVGSCNFELVFIVERSKIPSREPAIIDSPRHLLRVALKHSTVRMHNIVSNTVYVAQFNSMTDKSWLNLFCRSSAKTSYIGIIHEYWPCKKLKSSVYSRRHSLVKTSRGKSCRYLAMFTI